jgi:hypothetical protein
MTSPLERLATAGKDLKTEPPDAKEFVKLRESGIVRLADARNEGLSRESRFDLVYNAAHALCLAALRHHGYRPANRYLVFQLLPHTLGLGPEVWRVLNKGHDTRNQAEYHGHAEFSDRLIEDMIVACTMVEQRVKALPIPR